MPTTKDISIGVLASLAMRLIIIVLVGQDGNRFLNRPTTRSKALVSLYNIVDFFFWVGEDEGEGGWGGN